MHERVNKMLFEVSYAEQSTVIVSATRRSRDIKIPLCLSAPVVSVTTMDARKSAIFSFQLVTPILQTFTHLIQ